MYEMAKKGREAMKAKARRLASEKDSKVDSSDWKPSEPMNADVKTGMRPISRRAYKTGGKVSGEACAPRADRKPRKAGGCAVEKINRNVKEANEEREGKKHVGGMKAGGRAKKQNGGDAIGEFLKKDNTPEPKPEPPQPSNRTPDVTPEQARAMQSRGHMNPAKARKDGGYVPHSTKAGKPVTPGMKKGGKAEKEERAERKRGGRVGKTNINIVIATKPGDGPATTAPGMPRPPGGVPVPVPAAAPPAAAPMPMPMPMPAGPPPMARKRGGRVAKSYRDMTAGAGSGEGRLQKTEIQANKR